MRYLAVCMALAVVVAVGGFTPAAAAGGRLEHASAMVKGAVANGSSAPQSRVQDQRRASVARTRAELPPYQVLEFAPVGARTAWALTVGNQDDDPPQSVLRSSDGGAHWSTVTPAGLTRGRASKLIGSADFLDPMRAWIEYGTVFGPQVLLVTSDGGRIWTRAGRTPTFCEVQFVNRLDGWCVNIDGAAGSEFVAIYRTTTAGRTWRQVSHNNPSDQKSTPDPIPFGCDKGVAFTSPSDGFASSFCDGGGGYIYATTDGGSRWHQQLSLPFPLGGNGGSGFTTVVARGKDDAVGYTVYGPKGPSSSVVYDSADGGLRWTEVLPPGHSKGYDVDILTPRVWRLVAGRTVLVTDNAGRTWARTIANVVLSQASQLAFTTTDVAWDFPTDGTSDNVLHTTDGGRQWTRVHVPQ